VRGAPPPTILLDAGHALEGRVCAEDGSPVAGARVVASFAAAGTARWDSDERPLVAGTDATGAFRLAGLPEGTVELMACPPGTWFARSHMVRVPHPSPVEITLPLYPLEGVVKDKRTGAPLAGANVYFATSGFHMSNTLVRATTDAHGCLHTRVPNRWLGRGEVTAPGYLLALHLGPSTPNPPDLEQLAGRTTEFCAVPAARLRGTVVCAGHAASGAVVRATWLTGFELPSAATRSGPDGSFKLWAYPGLLHLAAAWPGASEEDDQDLDVLLATGSDGDRGLVLAPASGRDGLQLAIAQPGFGRITGRVVRPDGAPARGWVKLAGGPRPPAARTTPAGTFELEGVAPGPVRLLVQPREGDKVEVSVCVAPGKTTSGVEIVVPAPPRIRVEGRVVFEGSPVPDAYVIAGWSGHHHPVRADESFAIEDKPIGDEILLDVVAPNHLGAALTTKCGKQEKLQLGDIPLLPADFAAFEVVAAEGGAPVPGVTATLVPQSSGPILCGPFELPVSVRTWRADERGRFRILLPLRGEWNLELRAPGFAGRDLDARLVPRQVVLRPPGVIAGRVRFPDGKPGAGVRVEAESDGEWHGPRDDRETRTDGEGRFRFDGLGSSPHNLIVNSGAAGPSIVERFIRGVAVPSESLEVVVSPALTIEGKVVDVRGRAVEGFVVEAEPKREDAASLETRTDARGAFRLAGAVDGSYKVRVSRDRGWAEAELEAVKAGTKDLLVRAEVGYRITGRVVDGAGRPRPGWVVYASWKAGGGDDRKVRTDAAGRFAFEGIDGGTWELKLGLWGGRTPDGGPALVTAGAEDVFLVLK